MIARSVIFMEVADLRTEVSDFFYYPTMTDIGLQPRGCLVKDIFYSFGPDGYPSGGDNNHTPIDKGSVLYYNKENERRYSQ